MSTRKPSQECPICGAGQPLDTRTCSICGAVLPGELTPVAPLPPIDAEAEERNRPRYNPAEGDDDLYVGDLSGRMWRLILAGGMALMLLLGVGLGVAISQLGRNDDRNSINTEILPEESEDDGSRPTAPPTATLRSTEPIVMATTARQITMTLATVTPAPPIPTETPLPGPCTQTAQEGDTVYGMAIRCGHQSMDVVDIILEMNGMESPQQLQLGQTLEIPWPTPTPSGEPAEEESAVPETDEENSRAAAETVPVAQVNEFGTPDLLVTYQNAEPTLRPGQAWHTVQSGETILSIAVLYETRLETLSQINPEVPFLQCDFGKDSGGPNCSVMLYEGQKLRVPVPLPTQTPTPSPVGTLTSTPTATATFNAPYLLTPDDDTRFFADQRVTLRWGGTGTLDANERYAIHVRDMDSGQDYLALVTDTMYELPGGWQPDDGDYHTFEWSIAIATINEQNNVLAENHATDSRQFTWESR